MDPLTEFAIFLFSWMLVILAVTVLGRRVAKWLRNTRQAPAAPRGGASLATSLRRPVETRG